MKTKLEMIAGYLAGRRDDSADQIRQELGDPANEACRFLEAMQEKSRGALRVNAPGRPARLWLPITSLALVGALILIAVGAAGWVHDRRLRSIEASLSRADQRWADRVARLETAVARGGNTTESALARLEAALGKLEGRLGEIRAARLDPDDPTVARWLRGLDDLRQDLGARARADRQDLQELRSAIDEALRSLRRLEARPAAKAPVQVPVPVLIPLPSQGQSPGQEHHDPDRGHPSQGSELQRPPADRRGPPTRTSGAPG
jgi:hypothetical protein